MSLEGIVPASTTGPLARKSEVIYETLKQDFVTVLSLEGVGLRDKTSVQTLEHWRD